MFQKYDLFALYLPFFRVKISFWYKYSKRLKTLKIGLKNAFGEFVAAGGSGRTLQSSLPPKGLFTLSNTLF